MKCLKCGSENSVGAKFCRGCGNGLNTSEPVATVITVPCLSCGQANVPGKKFCSKCGASMTAHAPLPAEQPPQAAIKISVDTPDGESNSCPKCGNSLKPAAKFCGKCGFNLEQKSSRQADEQNKVDSASIEAVDAIQLQKKTVAVTESISSPSVAKVDVPQVKPPVEQTKPGAMQPATRKPVVPPPPPASEKAKQRPSGLIAAIVVLWVCVIGGGAYWWFGLRQAVLSPVADVVNAPTTAVVTPASAVEAVSEPVVTPVAAEAAPPASAPSSVAPLVAKPVPLPTPTAHAASMSKEPKARANKNGETNDDRKLLNAIDQYLDKQK